MKLLFITGNEHKLREATEILGDIVEGKELDLLEIQSLNPKEIIREKLKEARAQVGEQENILMVEDVSFWIGNLNFPGPLFKFMLKALDREGIVTFAQGFKEEKARAECNIGILLPQEEQPHFFVGNIEGKVVHPRGESGFGFDPIFVPHGYEKTFAEMSADEKNAISHRKIALEKVKTFLESLQP